MGRRRPKVMSFHFFQTSMEGVRGDPSQNVPMIEKITAESVNIETSYLRKPVDPGGIRSSAERMERQSCCKSKWLNVRNIPELQYKFYEF